MSSQWRTGECESPVMVLRVIDYDHFVWKVRFSPLYGFCRDWVVELLLTAQSQEQRYSTVSFKLYKSKLLWFPRAITFLTDSLMGTHLNAPELHELRSILDTIFFCLQAQQLEWKKKLSKQMLSVSEIDWFNFPLMYINYRLFVKLNSPFSSISSSYLYPINEAK